MGQTLTHGIYLPDEGERNCYNGLAANWQILDTSVGTIAEHTTALAGKAPLVHTHTKADITDLFNSANTWSALNTYSNGQIRIKSQSQEIGVIPSSGVIQYLEFADKNNAQHGIVGLWDYAGGASEIQMYIADKFKNGAKDPTGTSESTFLSFGFKADGSKFLTFSGQVDNSVIPKANNSYDLGSSSNQWNNLYAKNYFYNGTAWGLDKANVWTAEQTYSKNLVITCTATPGVAPSTDMVSGFRMKNAENSYSFVEVVGRIGTSGVTYANLVATNKFKNGNIDVGGSSKSANIQVGIRANGDKFIYTDCEFRNSLVPYSLDLGNIHLGTSTNKWKSLNGINPGALSLPDYDNADPINFSQWDVTGAVGPNSYTPTVNGWLNISIWDRATNSIFVYRSGRERVGVFGNGSMAADGRIALLMPVQANATYTIIIKASANSDIYTANFFPCLGNV